MKPHHGLVLLIPPLSRGNLQKFLWCVRGEQGPSLVALHQSVPRTGPQGVNVNSSPRPSWPHHKPPIGGPLGLTSILEQIITEVFWDNIVFQQSTLLWVLRDNTRKQIRFLLMQYKIISLTTSFKQENLYTALRSLIVSLHALNGKLIHYFRKFCRLVSYCTCICTVQHCESPSYNNYHLSEGSIEDVHRAVVSAVLHVLDIVLHFHLDRVAIIVLATLELLVSVLPCKPLQYS